MQTWTEAEEKAFEQLMTAGRMKRLRAIRLYRRSKNDLTRALKVAAAEAPTEAEIARRKAFGDAARERAAKRWP